MSKKPWYKRYPSDFIAGALRLTLEQKGAYHTLVDLIMDQDGLLPLDDRQWLARCCGCSVRKFNTVLKELLELDKFQINDGYLVNKRAEKELKTRRKHTENDGKTEDKPEINTSENEVEVNLFNDLDEKKGEENASHVPEAICQKLDNKKKITKKEIDQFFESFWTEYPRKIGKQGARKAYEKALKSADPPEILAGLRRSANRWNAEKTEEKFIPHCSTWLNQGRWADYPGDGGPGIPTPANFTDDEWRIRLKMRANGNWDERWGPQPGEPGCFVPPELIQTLQ